MVYTIPSKFLGACKMENGWQSEELYETQYVQTLRERT